MNPATVMSELETMIQHPREGRDPVLRSTSPGLLACYPYWVVTCGPCIWAVALETPCPIPHTCEQGSAPAMLHPCLAFPVSLAGECLCEPRLSKHGEGECSGAGTGGAPVRRHCLHSRSLCLFKYHRLSLLVCLLSRSAL